MSLSNKQLLICEFLKDWKSESRLYEFIMLKLKEFRDFGKEVPKQIVIQRCITEMLQDNVIITKTRVGFIFYKTTGLHTFNIDTVEF